MIVRALQTGKDAAGLTRYLFGPGKANEHTNQRMIAGSAELTGEWSGQALTMREATHLGRVVEASWRRQYAPELAMVGAGQGGVARENLRAGDDAVAGQDHVFHATISLHPSEGPFTDEQWAEIAARYMNGMGFTGRADHPDVSWYAVHHGLSKDGNDHIHIVACTTLRDGSRVDLHNSGRRSQEVRREVLEKLDFVTPLHETKRAENTPRQSDYTAAEHNIARERAKAGRGPSTPDRVLLQRILRAAAAEATTEAGYINNVIKHPRMEVVAARWAPGTDKQEVTGYKIRFKDGVWFSATTLSPDLSLSKLRKNWTAETDDSRSYARALWAEQARGEKRVATPDVPVQLEHAAAELRAANDALAQLDPHDLAAWNHVTAAAAGATAVMATAAPREVDAEGRDVAGFGVDAGRASDVLTRQWLADNYQAPAAPSVPTGLSRMEVATRHLQLAIRAAGTDRHHGWLAVLQQLTRTMNAIADAKSARGEAVAAMTLQRDAVAAMGRLEAWLGGRVDELVDQGAGTSTSGPEPVLSEAARAAREASGHATTDRSSTPATAPAHGQDATVDRGRTRDHGHGPRRS